MFGWFTKEEKVSKKWNISLDEALELFGSATAILDAMAADKDFRYPDPIIHLMLMERREKNKIVNDPNPNAYEDLIERVKDAT